jgi:sugar phosphate isomerase/epimerase
MAPTFLSVTAGSATVSAAKGVDQMLTLAEDLNAIGSVCRKSGIGFAYHNHHMEFARFGDAVGFEILLAHTDPALVSMELDVGWAIVAGADGTDYLERHPERFIACHFKDFDPARPTATVSRETPIPEMTQLIPPGAGTLDFTRLLSVMDRIDLRHGYVEVDVADDPMEASRSAFRYLAALP